VSFLMGIAKSLPRNGEERTNHLDLKKKQNQREEEGKGECRKVALEGDPALLPIRVRWEG